MRKIVCDLAVNHRALSGNRCPQAEQELLSKESQAIRVANVTGTLMVDETVWSCSLGALFVVFIIFTTINDFGMHANGNILSPL